MAFDASGEFQTARIGQFLFRQDFASASEAVLLEEAVVHRPQISLAPVTLSAGTVLVEADLGGGYSGFCSPDAVWRSDSMLDGRVLRVCLLDVDADGAFDFPFWIGMHAGDALAFAPMTLWRRTYAPNNLHARYERRAEGARQLTAGAVITRSLQGYRIRFAVAGAREPNVLNLMGGAGAGENRVVGAAAQSDGDASFRVADLPVRLEFLGSVVEVMSINDGVVGYRVVEGFGEALSVAHLRALPSPHN